MTSYLSELEVILPHLQSFLRDDVESDLDGEDDGEIGKKKIY